MANLSLCGKTQARPLDGFFFVGSKSPALQFLPMFASVPPFTLHTFESSPLREDTFYECVDIRRFQQLLNTKYDVEYTPEDKAARALPFNTLRHHPVSYTHLTLPTKA